MTYEEFLKTKDLERIEAGFKVRKSSLNEHLFPFQRDIVAWALQKGKAATFTDCGTGKTIMQLEFAHQVCKRTHGRALIIAPLAVVGQTKKEGEKFGIEVNICRTKADVKKGIGSEVYQAVLNGRRGIGIELKSSYYKCAVHNLQMAEVTNKQMDIFSFIGGEE